jgi:hypothetical protein
MNVDYDPITEEFLHGTPENGWGVHRDEDGYRFTVIKNNDFITMLGGPVKTVEEAIKEAHRIFLESP